jgi:hypothetical protein
MRTSVRMGIGPHRPIKDIEAHLRSGELRFATAIAKDFRREKNQPIPIGVALLFLPVVLTQRPEDYDDWACRWLGRWLTETPGATAERAADLADGLVELKLEPSAMEGIKTAAGVR